MQFSKLTFRVITFIESIGFVDLFVIVLGNKADLNEVQYEVKIHLRVENLVYHAR